MLEIPIYYTTSHLITEHSAVLKGADLDSGIRDDVEEWDTLSIKLPDFAALRFKAFTLAPDGGNPARHKGDAWEFLWRITLEGNGPNVTATWEMAAPNSQPYNGLGKKVKTRARRVDDVKVVHKICSEDFDAFPMNNF